LSSNPSHSRDGQAETQEALEVINDARTELKKDRPNKLRLRSFLAGLARDVRVVDGTASPQRVPWSLGPADMRHRRPQSDHRSSTEEANRGVKDAGHV
jgi:hypothetical protein